MKRNNKNNQGYGRSSRRSEDKKFSPNSGGQERDRKSPSAGKFFEVRDERPEKPGRTVYNKPKTDWAKNSERNRQPFSARFGSGREERKQGDGKFGFTRSNQKRREAPGSDSHKYGRQGFSKGEYFSSEGKPFFKNKSGEKTERQDSSSYRTLYKGRGKNQKPIYETVKKEDYVQKKPSKKFFTKAVFKDNGPSESKPRYDFKKYENRLKPSGGNEEIRLNKYIANAGICSRREADTLIQSGQISVNGVIVKELGQKVKRKDKVQYQGKILNPEKPVYVLLNKPKDFITTTDDPMERKTVMSLVSNACEERIFPVGRLDRNSTGLLLFTNDGDLADKLASPVNEIKKIYQVTLDKPLATKDADTILEGLTLEDGLAKVDDMQVLSKDRTILGMEIHMGKNRIVRRIFAALGYEVVALDRVMYAGLTKKDLSRGNYRFLSEKEVINLKFFS